MVVGFLILTHYVLFPVTSMSPHIINLVAVLTEALMLRGKLQENASGIENSVKAAPVPVSSSYFPGLYDLNDGKRSL